MMFREYLEQRGMEHLIVSRENSLDTICIEVDGHDLHVTVTSAIEFILYLDEYTMHNRTPSLLDHRYHVKKNSPYNKGLHKNFQKYNWIFGIIREAQIMNNHTESLRTFINNL